ncbi:hypothetical protein BYT27DRAFT_7260921 [Phlegmacium glaucopus]|nr:hypothetical protein BYT27DRAFT_7260921 [Phlegmacium glaucopus]
METRTRNRTTHPGLADKTTNRRSTAEVQQERAAKACAKAAHKEAKQQSIDRAAAFEHAEMANEDMVDTTPRPSFTPKPWPPPRNHKTSNLIPIAESSDSDVEMSGSAFFVEISDVMDESTDDEPSSPAKKRARATQKAMAGVGVKSSGAKTAVKKKVDDSDVEIVPPSDEELPKPKKVKVRDEINIATKKMEGGEDRGNKYRNMVKSMSSNRAEGLSGKPVPKASLQVQPAEGGRGLKREGLMLKAIKVAEG